MTELVKYGRFEPKNIETTLEALTNGHIGLNGALFPPSSSKLYL
jgi:hypothetical protein